MVSSMQELWGSKKISMERVSLERAMSAAKDEVDH